MATVAQSSGAAVAPVTTVQVVGGNLFRLALQYLGDATQWSRIASLNGLTDFIVPGPMTLTIPPVNPNASGGILPTPTG